MFRLDILNYCIQLDIQKLQEKIRGVVAVYSRVSDVMDLIYWVIICANYRAFSSCVHDCADLTCVMRFSQNKVS